MSLIDGICGHRSVKHRNSDDLRLALETVKKFTGRRFKVKGPGIKASGVPGEEVIRFVEEELPGYYTYSTTVKTYSDRHKRPHARIEIKGTMSLSKELNRYNPLDVNCTVKTENPVAD